MILKFKEKVLFYTSQGEGNPLVLLHGFLESSSIWNYFTEDLSKRRQVVCIDLPGHGKSEVLEEVHTMELMAEAVHAVLQHLKVKKATLAGHSMGGYVSLAFYEKFPIMTAGLVLINSTPEADTAAKKENRDRAIALVQKNKEVYVNMAISNLLTPKNNLKFKTELQKIKDEAFNFPTKGITAALKGMKIRTNKISLFQGFPRLKYIVAGKDDPILNYTDLQQIAAQCNSPLKTFPDGHLSYLENQQALQNFMHFIE